MKEVKLSDLLKAIVRRGRIIILVVFCAIVLSAVYYFAFVPDVYTASSTLYVLTQQNEDSVSYNDLTGSALLINDYRELVLSHKVTNSVAQSLSLDSLDAYDIQVEALSNTRIIQISVTGGEAYMAANIANGLATTFSESVIDIMRIDNVSVIDEARVPEAPSGPPRERNIILIAIVALLVSILVVCLIELFSTTFKSASDIEKRLGIPVLAQIAKVDPKHMAKGRNS